MRTITLAAGMLAGSILLPACADDNATAPLQAPSFNFMNNPDNGNIRIARYGSDFAVSWTDPSSGLRATHTTIPLGDPQETGCGPQEVLDPLDVQDMGLIDLDNEFSSWLHSNVTGRLWVIVRDVNQAGGCFGNRLIAEGWGRLHYTDNDVFGVVDKNANAWGFVGSGSLTTPDGSEVGYDGHARFTVTNQGILVQENAVISIH